MIFGRFPDFKSVCLSGSGGRTYVCEISLRWRGDTGKRPSVTPDSHMAVFIFFLFFWPLNLQSADNRSAVERETRGRRGVKGEKREKEREGVEWGRGRPELGYDYRE